MPIAGPCEPTRSTGWTGSSWHAQPPQVRSGHPDGDTGLGRNSPETQRRGKGGPREGNGGAVGVTQWVATRKGKARAWGEAGATPHGDGAGGGDSVAHSGQSMRAGEEEGLSSPEAWTHLTPPPLAHTMRRSSAWMKLAAQAVPRNSANQASTSWAIHRDVRRVVIEVICETYFNCGPNGLGPRGVREQMGRLGGLPEAPFRL